MYVSYGCGPAVYAVFSCPLNDNSKLLVKATVTNMTTGQVVAYILKPQKGQIRIGHGMCSGAFVFKNNENYQVEFDIVNQNGEFLNWSNKPIKFKRLTYKNAINYDEKDWPYKKSATQKE